MGAVFLTGNLITDTLAFSEVKMTVFGKGPFRQTSEESIKNKPITITQKEFEFAFLFGSDAPIITGQLNLTIEIDRSLTFCSIEQAVESVRFEFMHCVGDTLSQMSLVSVDGLLRTLPEILRKQLLE